MRRFLKSYFTCLCLLGLLLVLCMGCPFGMVLPVLFRDHAFLFWMLAACLPAVIALAAGAWRRRRGAAAELQREEVPSK